MRALLSVYYKDGIVEFAQQLVALGWDLVSSGGTSKALTEASIPHVQVEEVTGAAEMLGGRVKTLHPNIHGGILADRSKRDHMATLQQREIAPIDLVVSNLYPFRSDPSIEMIDVGGPTMVRAAAKNHAHVGIVVDPADYPLVLEELRANRELSDATRRRLARQAFAHTAAYDAAIVTWFDETSPEPEVLPPTIHLALERAQGLRYGENPHQEGARYRFMGEQSWWDSVEVLGGKQLSLLNLRDAEAAVRLVYDDLGGPSVAIVKHANPSGVAVHEHIVEAYRRALAGDPDSAFGGIVAVNTAVSPELADAITSIFTEIVVAPDYSSEALKILQAQKNLRILKAGELPKRHLDYFNIDDGLLLQTSDRSVVDRSAWRVVTEQQPTPDEWRDMVFAWRVSGHVTSNSIVLAKDMQAWIGAGQQKRVDSARIASLKAASRAMGGACASEAFFPKPDGVEAAAEAGASAIIQTGGSKADKEVIARANELGRTMVFTGERHFLH